ncbi:MAG: 6-hydroxymethylpterin diphosphokinase MptE-like protein [Spirochaetota bacterium]
MLEMVLVNAGTLYDNINSALVGERLGAIQRNITRNLPSIRKWGGLGPVVQRFSGKHVIVCGAGPSLENSMNELKKYYQRKELVILAVDMALKPLLKAGITPSFVISCESTPVPFFYGVSTERMHLLAFSGMSNINVRQWKGRMSFYNWLLRREPFNELWKQAGEELGYVATASIVTTQAVSLVLGCNIRSLILAGNDLAFDTRYYTAGSMAMEQAALRQCRTIPAETDEYMRILRKRHYRINRRDMQWYTDHQFLAAKVWLDELFRKVNVPVYDCSLPGCSEKYVHKTTIKEIIRELLPSRKKRRT